MDYLCYDLIAKQNSTRRIITMDHQNHNIESRKNKHLNFKERITIELRLKDGLDCQHFLIHFLFGHICKSILNWSHIV